MKVWFQENKERLWVLFGIILVGILSFEAGLLQGKLKQATPLILSVPLLSQDSVENPVKKDGTITPEIPGGSVRAEPVVAKFDGQGAVQANCVFVGSKNSNKYHLSSCAVAKRIKPENKVCFASKEEAEKRGYVPSCLK